MINYAYLTNLNRAENEQHPYHLVGSSPWPIMLAISLCSLVIQIIEWLYSMDTWVTMMLFLVFLYSWFHDIMTEAGEEGSHTFKVRQGIKLGMVLFMASEVMFFFSFFWAFCHCSLTPMIQEGSSWPPYDIWSFDAWALPLVNSIMLLLSGWSVTYAHSGIIKSDRSLVIDGFKLTMVLGALFSLIQYYEYNEASFNLTDSVYGSLFFMLTGFHGLHIIVGSMMLIICSRRQINNHITNMEHVGFDCSIWYWHFVDVVWLYLIVLVYIWGSNF